MSFLAGTSKAEVVQFWVWFCDLNFRFFVICYLLNILFLNIFLFSVIVTENWKILWKRWAVLKFQVLGSQSLWWRSLTRYGNVWNINTCYSNFTVYLIWLFAIVAVSSYMDTETIFEPWFGNDEFAREIWVGYWTTDWWFHLHLFFFWEWFFTPYAYIGNSRGLKLFHYLATLSQEIWNDDNVKDEIFYWH